MRAMPKSVSCGLAVLGEQDVARFHVAMQGAAPVRRLQRTGQLDPDVDRVAPVDRAHLVDPRIQGTSRVVLHHDVRPTRRGRADLKDADDVRVPGELSHRALLAEESL